MDMTADALTFLLTAAAGMACGILFDIFRVLGGFGTKKRLIPVFDLIFVLASAFMITAAFYIYSSCRLRLYMFVGVFIGVILYFLLFSSLIVRILKKIFKLFEIIFKILLTPVHFLYKILVIYFFKPFVGLIGRIASKIKYGFVKINTVRGSIFYGKNKRNKGTGKSCKRKEHGKGEKKAQTFRRAGSSRSGIYADKGSHASAGNN
jgi:spore cortex biosynthesis protein YabQ